MKKKFYISLFTFVFFLSTTALPLYIHVCKMNIVIPDQECELDHKGSNNNCGCKTKNLDNSENVKGDDAFTCCNTGISDKNVKDVFVSAKHDNSKFKPVNLLNVIIASKGKPGNTNNISFTKTGSSSNFPLINKIYLHNSVLLI